MNKPIKRSSTSYFLITIFHITVVTSSLTSKNLNCQRGQKWAENKITAGPAPKTKFFCQDVVNNKPKIKESGWHYVEQITNIKSSNWWRKPYSNTFKEAIYCFSDGWTLFSTNVYDKMRMNDLRGTLQGSSR